jgi:hypothetical protein
LKKGDGKRNALGSLQKDNNFAFTIVALHGAFHVSSTVLKRTYVWDWWSTRWQIIYWSGEGAPVFSSSSVTL